METNCNADQGMPKLKKKKSKAIITSLQICFYVNSKQSNVWIIMQSHPFSTKFGAVLATSFASRFPFKSTLLVPKKDAETRLLLIVTRAGTQQPSAAQTRRPR